MVTDGVYRIKDLEWGPAEEWTGILLSTRTITNDYHVRQSHGVWQWGEEQPDHPIRWRESLSKQDAIDDAEEAYLKPLLSALCQC